MYMGFPGGSVPKNPANSGDAGNAGSIPGWGRSPGGGNGNPLQSSCLENPMDKGAWWAIRSQRVRHDWAYMQKIYIYIYAHYVCIHIHHILIIVCRLATKFQLIIFCVSKMAWPIEAYQNLFRKQICGKGNIFKFWQMNDEFLNAIKIRKYILERKKSPWIYYLELHHR